MNQKPSFAVSPGRRSFLKAAAFLALSGAAGPAAARVFKPRVVNPCADPSLDALSEIPWLASIWEGLDPAQIWDCHVHLTGIGDSDNGLRIGPQLKSLLHPVFYAQRLFYINAGCVSGQPAGTVDENYVHRLAALVENIQPGFKAMLLAFDWHHGDDGIPLPGKSTFYVPDDYARRVAAERPDVFEWIASIHPYRPDAVDRLEAAAAQGAKAVKWLPASHNIDPASPRCDAFFAALARLRVPLITHCGAEKAAVGANVEHFGNPLRLRRALDAGVRVVVAHCASYGKDEDLDAPGKRKQRASFDLFARLMDRPEWKGQLFGDISAIVLRNRKKGVIKTLLARDDWHGRLLNGSDYPLPGILPITSPRALAANGLLPKERVAGLEWLREHNALYFDLALKRSLAWKGHSFSAQAFETRRFFETDKK